LLAEVQCLVNGRPEFNPNSGGNSRVAPPRRAADGFPLQRLQLICAVIEKRLQLPLWNKDVYVNVVGGLRVSEPSADLAVAMSVISSALEEAIRPKTAFIGEIGEYERCLGKNTMVC
jgi:predicted ATP-dependent serine protease